MRFCRTFSRFNITVYSLSFSQHKMIRGYVHNAGLNCQIWCFAHGPEHYHWNVTSIFHNGEYPENMDWDKQNSNPRIKVVNLQWRKFTFYNRNLGNLGMEKRQDGSAEEMVSVSVSFLWVNEWVAMLRWGQRILERFSPGLTSAGDEWWWVGGK